MTSIMPIEPRRHLLAIAALLACAGLVALPGAASASLIGAQVSYQSLFPNTQSVLSNLGTKTVAPLTSFADVQNGLSSFIIGNQLVIENTSPLAFATASFNGPQLAFSNGGLTGATIDPASSADFRGAVSFTGNSVQANFSAFTPALGSTMTINLASSVSLAGQQVAYKYLLPTTGSVQEDLGVQPVRTGTSFVDAADGITVVVGADKIIVLNNVPLAFAAGTFNGPDLVFSGVRILSAAIDPVSAADFQGALSSTLDSIAINFAKLAPATGHALVIDIVSVVPEPSVLLLMALPIPLLGWARRNGTRLR